RHGVRRIRCAWATQALTFPTRVSEPEPRALANEVALKFGNGGEHLTSRQVDAGDPDDGLPRGDGRLTREPRSGEGKSTDFRGTPSPNYCVDARISGCRAARDHRPGRSSPMTGNASQTRSRPCR